MRISPLAPFVTSPKTISSATRPPIITTSRSNSSFLRLVYLSSTGRYIDRKNELLDRLVVIMGGRVAEEIVFGDVTNGATGDIRMATGIARKMVCEWGMSERLGMVEYGEHEDYVFLGRDIARSRAYSESTAQEIDREVKRLCDDAYQQAMKILTQRKETLIAIAKLCWNTSPSTVAKCGRSSIMGGS